MNKEGRSERRAKGLKIEVEERNAREKWKSVSIAEKSIVRFVLKKDGGPDLTEKTHWMKEDRMKRRMKSGFAPMKPIPNPFSDPLTHLEGGCRL